MSIGDGYFLELIFGIWAFVVAYGVRVLSVLRGDVRDMSIELHKYVVRTEARLAVLEDRASLNNLKD